MRKVTGPGNVPARTLIVTSGSPAEADTTRTEYSARLIHGVLVARVTTGRASYVAPLPTGVFHGDVLAKGHCLRSRVPDAAGAFTATGAGRHADAAIAIRSAPRRLPTVEACR